MKLRHSDSLILVWRVAEAEARHLKSATIGPTHLLLGLCKTVDLDLPRLVANDASDRNEVLEELLREVRRLKNVFKAAGLDVKTFRRRLRRTCPPGRFALPEEGRLHRSDAAKEIFEDAESLAQLAGGLVYPIHLLHTVLLARNEERDALFQELGIAKRRLQEKTKQALLLHRAGPGLSSSKGRARWN